MPLWALWRRNWAVWMMPATTLFVSTWNNEQLPYFDRYPFWMAAQKTHTLILLGMITCLAGAAEGGWQRRARMNQWPAVRGLPLRLGLPIVLTWFPTTAILMLGVIGVGGLPAWQVWLTSLVSLLAWTCVGMALGMLLRAAVALPLAVLAAFGWFAYTPAIEPPWPRHLSGTWAGCCTPGETPNTGVAIGVLLVALGLCLTSAGLMWVWVRNRGSRVAWVTGLLVPAMVTFAVAGAISHKIGYTPTQPRSDPVTCWSGTPEICLWPDHQEYGEADAQDLRVITAHWAALGVRIPPRLSQSALEPSNGTAPLIYNHSDSPTERAKNLALGLVIACGGNQAGEPTQGLDYFTAQAWLRVNSGVHDSDVRTDGLEAFLKQPMSEQVALLNKALTEWECQ